MPKPIIKWVGGKTRLLNEIKALMPMEFNNYFEPFVGGGALFFSLDLKEDSIAFINDYNSELTNLYEVVRDDPCALSVELEKHRANDSKDHFYKVRALDRSDEFKDVTAIERAARLVYLNKACFNGLYRVNKKGQFNVPYASPKTLAIPTKDSLVECQTKLSKTEVLTGDFENIKPLIKKGDLVYLDPPYVDTFVDYTSKGFDKEMQVRVRDLCKYIDDIGAHFIASNSTAAFVYELYADFDITEVDIQRLVGSKAASRGKIQEVLITNIKKEVI